MSDVDVYAKKIWDYMLMHHELKPADAIFIMGSNDLRVAERGAELYQLGLAPWVICSGGNGKASMFNRPESEVFADVLVKNGVQRAEIILESKSSNTGENITFTRALIQERYPEFKNLILVHKPYMERRAFATFEKQWPEANGVITSPELSYEGYALTEDLRARFINVMVGDLQRLKQYPALGYMTEYAIPHDVYGKPVSTLLHLAIPSMCYSSAEL